MFALKIQVGMGTELQSFVVGRFQLLATSCLPFRTPAIEHV